MSLMIRASSPARVIIGQCPESMSTNDRCAARSSSGMLDRHRATLRVLRAVLRAHEHDRHVEAALVGEVDLGLATRLRAPTTATRLDACAGVVVQVGAVGPLERLPAGERHPPIDGLEEVGVRRTVRRGEAADHHHAGDARRDGDRRRARPACWPLSVRRRADGRGVVDGVEPGCQLVVERGGRRPVVDAGQRQRDRPVPVPLELGRDIVPDRCRQPQAGDEDDIHGRATVDVIPDDLLPLTMTSWNARPTARPPRRCECCNSSRRGLALTADELAGTSRGVRSRRAALRGDLARGWRPRRVDARSPWWVSDRTIAAAPAAALHRDRGPRVGHGRARWPSRRRRRRRSRRRGAGQADPLPARAHRSSGGGGPGARPGGPDRRAVRPDPTITGTLVEAVAGRRGVRISYTSGSGTAVETRADPWAVVVRHGRWYLLCFAHAPAATRAFRIDRIDAVDILNVDIDSPDDLDPVAYLEHHLGTDGPTRPASSSTPRSTSSHRSSGPHGTARAHRRHPVRPARHDQQPSDVRRRMARTDPSPFSHPRRPRAAPSRTRDRRPIGLRGHQ